MARAPVIAPLDLEHQLAARRIITEHILAAWWTTGSWAAADRSAADLIDALKGDGVELVKVDWR